MRLTRLVTPLHTLVDRSAHDSNFGSIDKEVQVFD